MAAVWPHRVQVCYGISAELVPLIL